MATPDDTDSRPTLVEPSAVVEAPARTTAAADSVTASPDPAPVPAPTVNDEPSGVQRRPPTSRERVEQVSEGFRKLAREVSRTAGSPLSFGVALGVILLWAVSGPIFGFSDTWQLVINTSTTIITFLMVFLVQSTQNRDNECLQLKLDELLRAVQSARSSLIDIETLPESKLRRIEAQFHQLRAEGASEEEVYDDQARTAVLDRSNLARHTG